MRTGVVMKASAVVATAATIKRTDERMAIRPMLAALRGGRGLFCYEGNADSFAYLFQRTYF